MGDRRRFDVFAKFIKKQFGYVEKIADVAGGKGYLQTALREHGYDVITYDKRKGRKNRTGKFEYRYKYFSETVDEEFDLIVGMHPDEATDVIIVEAIKRMIPFIVVPCCVKPTAVLFNEPHNYTNWMKHLKRIAERAKYTVSEIQLKISGKNMALIGRPVKRYGGINNG